MTLIDWIADRYWYWRHARPRGRERAWEAVPRARGLYPAYADWVGGFALDARGEVWFSESPAEWIAPERVKERAIRHAATGVAVRRYPELASLSPVRGPDDPICPTCKGAGRSMQLPPKLRYWIVCECGGLGWIPHESQSARSEPDAPAV